MATLADVELLGIFEDRAQSDFVVSLVEGLAPRYGHHVIIEPRLTAGCRFDYLNDHFRLAVNFAGVIVGVDGAGYRRDRKVVKLCQRCQPAPRTLWSVTEPAIEEWLMADEQALPEALRAEFGAHNVRPVLRPGRSNAERTAKDRLRSWIEQMLDAPPLLGGVEYAAEVARRVEPERVGGARNPDFRQVLVELPDFLNGCS